MTQRIKPEVLQAFLKKCVSIRTFTGGGNDLKEHCISIDLDEVRNFYVSQIGVPPLVQSVEEIGECLKAAVGQAKKTRPDEYRLVVRLHGECKPWLAIKIYTMLVYECDQIVYGGDVLIRL